MDVLAFAASRTGAVAASVAITVARRTVLRSFLRWRADRRRQPRPQVCVPRTSSSARTSNDAMNNLGVGSSVDVTCMEVTADRSDLGEQVAPSVLMVWHLSRAML
jgi:hypothetical protein